MKSIFITHLLAVISAWAFAQNTEHLTFKSVPINGTLEEYVSKLKLNGFNSIFNGADAAILSGDFAGYKGCMVEVSTLKEKNLVHKINVHFPNEVTWSALSANYYELKKMLTGKYGTPAVDVEEFDGSHPTDDRISILKVQSGNCKYYSVWQTPKGDIRLSIDHKSFSDCFVKLTYVDKINSAIINSKAKDDL